MTTSTKEPPKESLDEFDALPIVVNPSIFAEGSSFPCVRSFRENVSRAVSTSGTCLTGALLVATGSGTVYDFDFSHSAKRQLAKFKFIQLMSAIAAPTKRRRSEFPESENLCDHCTAKCCHYFALAIDEPVNRRDYDFMRWYLLHDRATVFVEGETWYLLVHTTCKHLRDDYRCGIYENRPQICREYTTAECEFEDDWCYEKYFETPEQIDEYADALFGPQFPDDSLQDCDSLRGPKPTGLPVL